MERRYRNHTDFFFPVALITAGTIWLMVNNGLIAPENLARLLPFWPALLILGGLGLILRQLWWPLPGLMWLAAGAAVIWLLMAPEGVLPRAVTPEFQRETLSEPLGGARSANIQLDLSINPSTIHALPQGDDLIVADVYHLGDMVFKVSGSDPKTVRLDEETNFQWIQWPSIMNVSEQRWDIGLSPDVPIDLEVGMSTGSSEMDLSQLQLSAFKLDGSTGRTTVQLPEDSQRYNFTLDQSTGGVTVIAPEDATFDMEVDGSTGSLTIDVAEGAGVQVEVRDDGPGHLSLPDDFRKVRQGNDDNEGVWENDAYADSPTPIRIVLEISTGSITIK